MHYSGLSTRTLVQHGGERDWSASERGAGHEQSHGRRHRGGGHVTDRRCPESTPHDTLHQRFVTGTTSRCRMEFRGKGA